MEAVAFDTRVQLFALGRLQRATEKRRLKSAQMDRLFPNGLPANRTGETCRLYLRLLDRAVYSMYLDCLETGVGQEAQGLLSELRKATVCSR